MRLTEEQKDLVVNACRNGATIKQVAARYSVSESTIDRLLRKRRDSGIELKLTRGRPQKTKWKPIISVPAFDIRPVTLSIVKDMCAQHHVYGSVGAYAVYNFAVFENGVPVAAFSWSTPPYGAAQTTCPEAPHGVLALSRMVAVPRDERALRHISKPLRFQIRALIDRTRWPVLITYSDEGQGHTGHVYKCSGWTPTKRTRRSFYVDERGSRRSTPSRSNSEHSHLRYGGKTTLQCWEHRVCPAGETADWMAHHGWHRTKNSDTATVWVKE